MYFDDLENLDNVLDKIEPDIEKLKIMQDDTSQILETIIQVMEDYINDNPCAIIEEDFHESFIEDVRELMEIQLGYDELEDNDDFDYFYETKEKLEDLVEEAAEYFYEHFMPERSF